jgi:hypothetical protein
VWFLLAEIQCGAPKTLPLTHMYSPTDALSDEENEEEEVDPENCISEDGSSVSSFSESEMSDRSFDPMPARLTLPVELQRLVLSCKSSQYYELWGTHRLGEVGLLP